MVVAGLILGGGTHGGFLSDAILQLLAIPLLLVSIWRLFERPLTKQARMALWFCGAIALLPLLQLVPLPPWLWTALPNRQPSAEAFQILGRPSPWMPISVSPQATWLSALSLIPSMAIFLGTILLSYRERRYLSLVVIAVGILSVFVGLLQVVQGQQSPLRFFEISNPEEAVGFFANRNHFAALLYCLIPFVVAWTLDKTATTAPGKQKKPALAYDVSSIMAAMAGFTTLVIILAGEITARSRVGLALTIVALFGAMALGFSNRRVGSKLTPYGILLGAVAVAVVFSLQFGFYRVLERASDSEQGARAAYALTTTEAARAYMPVGSGIGTFVPVYAMFEKPEDVSLFYVNRAHNDLLEVWLETGVVGLILMGLFAVWLVRVALGIWRKPPPDGASALDWSLTRAGTIVVALLIVHSFFDYPLRTGAMMTIMAFACALLIEPFGAQSSEELQVARNRVQRGATSRLEPALSVRSLPSSGAGLAKSPEELQAALSRMSRSSARTPQPEVFPPHPSASPPTTGLAKSPAELQAALNKIRASQPSEPSETQPAQHRIIDEPRPEAEPPASTAASMSSQSAEPPDAASIPPDRRWGIGVQWPEAWSKPAKEVDQPTTPKQRE